MTKQKRIRRLLGLEVKSINEETRTLTGIASSESIDRYGDIIKQEGWDFKNFWDNPVMPWGHNYNDPPVATVEKLWLEDGKLMFEARFASKEAYAFADTIFQLFKEGILKAFSVGFRPKRWEDNKTGGRTYLEAELLEISAVTVPANPDAVTLAVQKGIGSEDEISRVFKALGDQDEDGDEDEEIEEKLKQLSWLNDLMAKNHDALKAYRTLGKNLAKTLNIEPGDDELQLIASIESSSLALLAQRATKPADSKPVAPANQPRTDVAARTALTPEMVKAIGEAVAQEFAR